MREKNAEMCNKRLCFALTANFDFTLLNFIFFLFHAFVPIFVPLFEFNVKNLQENKVN